MNPEIRGYDAGRDRQIPRPTSPPTPPSPPLRERPSRASPPRASPPRAAAAGGREWDRDTTRQPERDAPRGSYAASRGRDFDRDAPPPRSGYARDAPPAALATRPEFAPPPATAFAPQRSGGGSGGRWDGDRKTVGFGAVKVFERDRNAVGRARSPSPERVRQRCCQCGVRGKRRF